MSDWNDACDPTQKVKDREEARYERGRARWQKRKIAMGLEVGKLASLQGHDAAVDPDYDERF